MANNFHDIIPPEKRSIRNITTTHRHPRRGARQEQEPAEQADMPPTPPPRNPSGEPSQSFFSRFFSRFGLWLVAVVAIVIFVLAFSLLFSGSKVTVTPMQRDVFIDGQFSAFRTPEPGQLPYEIVSIERTLSQSVAATGEAVVEERASGQITIFNDFSSSEQRLITNTRFETPEGLIYRIDGPIVVPGQTETDGETVPGRIEVTVYADEPGASYNTGLTDFTIPGFKGSPRFEGFYARSKTAMSGGFVGKRLTADKTATEQARTALRTQLERDLREQAAAELPPGFQLFPDAVFITFESPPNVDRDDRVDVQEKATLYGVLFRNDALAQFIATNTVAGYEQDPVAVRDMSTLSFSIPLRETARPWTEEKVNFTLTGNAELIWLFDEEKLRADLAGRAKEALPTVLSGYPSIEQAEISLRPFWRQTFPDDVEKISIERRLLE